MAGNDDGTTPYVVKATTTKDKATTQAQCNITRGSYQGGRMCGTGWAVVDLTWSDGRQETFIVGWDEAVWHIYQRYAGDSAWSGWSSLGGGANSGVFGLSANPPGIWIYGWDNQPYCDVWTGSQWSGWFSC